MRQENDYNPTLIDTAHPITFTSCGGDALDYVTIITAIEGNWREPVVLRYEFMDEKEDAECVTRLLDRINDAGEINPDRWRRLTDSEEDQWEAHLEELNAETEAEASRREARERSEYARAVALGNAPARYVYLDGTVDGMGR